MKKCDINNRQEIINQLNEKRSLIGERFNSSISFSKPFNELRVHIKKDNKNSNSFGAAQYIRKLVNSKLGNIFGNPITTLNGNELVAVFNRQTIDKIKQNIPSNIPLIQIREGNEFVTGGEVFPTFEDARNELDNRVILNEELQRKLEDHFRRVYPEISLRFTNDRIIYNEDALNQIAENTVNYTLRSVNILSNLTEKQKQDWNKWKKGITSSEQLVNNLQFPKEQKPFVLNFLDSQPTKTPEQIALDIASEYSYTIEINTARGGNKDLTIQQTEFNGQIRWSIIDSYTTMPLKSFKTEQEANDYLIKELQKPTSHYSNLTVPGGTNYTENEISTPMITPSVKGHAQFSTDKGIGWFRSDDKTLVEKSFDRQAMDAFGLEDEVESSILKQVGVSNTRRILEVQSDLFQKGRDDKNLVKEQAKYLSTFNERYYKNEQEIKDNQFLQLLNKNNNWVTLFIKSIIQDSAKKSYEKVLFPLGDTASKIEGHTTLEEFKRQKERRINEIQRDLDDNRLQEEYIQSAKNEINQLKQELERVETEGFGALRPIYNFYENIVTNILKKQGYNPIEITDEYGNKWNEIQIKPEEHLESILLQTINGEIVGQANIKANEILINNILRKEDTLPHEYAHFYIREFINTPIVQEGIKRFGSEEKLVQAIGEQVVKQEGEAYNWWKRFANWLLNLLTDREILQILTDSFINRVNLNNQPQETSKIETKTFSPNYLFEFENKESDIPDIGFDSTDSNSDFNLPCIK